jgi:hypothetical protein
LRPDAETRRSHDGVFQKPRIPIQLGQELCPGPARTPIEIIAAQKEGKNNPDFRVLLEEDFAGHNKSLSFLLFHREERASRTPTIKKVAVSAQAADKMRVRRKYDGNRRRERRRTRKRLYGELIQGLLISFFRTHLMGKS